MVLQDGYFDKCCEKCYKQYTNIISKWCRLCQTSGNKQIDDFIQEKQLNIDPYKDIIFEWIPYNQFDNIKKISKSDSTKIYSAIWMDGPLYYNYSKYTRNQNEKVTLKYSHSNSQNINEFLNKV